MRILFDLLYFAFTLLSGWLLFLLCRPFVAVRLRWGTPILVLTLGFSLGMVIWIGDPNLLYTFPLFVAFFMMATRGDCWGRLAVCIIFFCLCMSIAALLDTYSLYLLRESDYADYVTRTGRAFIILPLYLGFRRFLPKETVRLSRPLWALVFALALMPLSALASTVLLTYRPYDVTADASVLSFRLGLGILPFVLLTSLVLLGAIIVLARQEKLEQEHALAVQRDIYYEGIRQQDQQLRELRHDLRNHVNTVSGLLDLGKTQEARAYLGELSAGDALSAPRRFCENDTASVVLAAKAEALTQSGIAYDFNVQLPEALPIAASDLCTLLGNALDNAREGALGVPGATVRCRARYEKGIFMLAVDNPTRGDVRPDLSTTKADKHRHGYGLASMKNIAARYDGSLETTIDVDGFHLLICLSPKAHA